MMSCNEIEHSDVARNITSSQRLKGKNSKCNVCKTVIHICGAITHEIFCGVLVALF